MSKMVVVNGANDATRPCLLTCAGTATLVMMAMSSLLASTAVVVADSVFPIVGKCPKGELLMRAQHETSWRRTIAPDDVEIFAFDLEADEFVLFEIKTGLPTRRRRRHLSTSLLDKITNCEEDDDEDGDDLIVQPFDIEPELVGCRYDTEDDDSTLIDHSDGGDSHAVMIEVKDDVSKGILNRKFPKSEFDGQVYVTSRGQKRQCGRPNALEISGIEGTGDVEIRAEYRRRDKWNLAPTDFALAPDVLTQPTWCGNLNTIKFGGEECLQNENTPKWKVWLEPNEKLLVSAVLKGRPNANPQKALRVMLRVYGQIGGPKVADILDESVLGEHEFQKSFVHNGSTSQFYYLELLHQVRHLYEYRMAFRVERECEDNPFAEIQVPQFDKTCEWLGAKQSRKDRFCTSRTKSNAHEICRQTCGGCGQSASSLACVERPTDIFYKKLANCQYIHQKRSKLIRKGHYTQICNGVAGTHCALACGKC